MSQKELVVNDFCITFSTVNGSGSATANTTLMRALFKMGIPVSSKNIFPSNIQGLPTWYTLRLSKDGYMGRVEQDDIIVAMNPTTLHKEMQYLAPGGVFLLPDDFSFESTRDDIIIYRMPVKKLVKDAEVPPSLRDYISNMVYVGVLSFLLGIELELIHQALDFQFKGRLKPIDQNYQVVEAAYLWSKQNLTKTDPYKAEKMHGTDDCIMTDGNTAAALGSIFGGVQFTGWYPITPATSLAESLMEYLPKYRVDPETGKDTFAVVQSEDELAAIGMAIGAGWGGLRSMTSTSGPGLSLMSEYIGLAYYAEVPVVIWDVQRVGPSTGMPTRTAQGDLTQANFISHGDKNMVILIPGSIQECFEFGWRAFDIAERLQTPVIVLSDLDFGMNMWTSKKFEYPDQPMDRGKVLWEGDMEEFLAKHGGEWGRYRDVDGDGIPWRTLPGNTHPKSAYFARGTSHNEDTGYTEDPEKWETIFNRIANKFETGKQYLPRAVADESQHAALGIIASGSADPAVQEARDMLVKKGIKTDYLRIRSLPFDKEVEDFMKKHEHLVVLDINRDGQLNQLLTMTYPLYAEKTTSLAHLDGLPLNAKWVESQILSLKEVK